MGVMSGYSAETPERSNLLKSLLQEREVCSTLITDSHHSEPKESLPACYNRTMHLHPPLRHRFSVMAIAIAIVVMPSFAHAFQVPDVKGQGFVIDQANVLTREQEASIEENLLTYQRRTTNEIGVLIVRTLDGEPAEDVATTTFRTWGIGSKEKNNGLLILVVTDDHTVRIETGNGLEGTVPDILAGAIIDETMLPRFREGNYALGITEGISALQKVIGGETFITHTQKPAETFRWTSYAFAYLIFFGVVGMLVAIVWILLGFFTRSPRTTVSPGSITQTAPPSAASAAINPSPKPPSAWERFTVAAAECPFAFLAVIRSMFNPLLVVALFPFVLSKIADWNTGLVIFGIAAIIMAMAGGVLGYFAWSRRETPKTQELLRNAKLYAIANRKRTASGNYSSYSSSHSSSSSSSSSHSSFGGGTSSGGGATRKW